MNIKKIQSRSWEYYLHVIYRIILFPTGEIKRDSMDDMHV